MRVEGPHGPAGHRVERVAEEIRNEVNLMLAGELKDPRLAGNVTITEVRLAPGMRTIRIFVHVDGTEEERKKTLKGLEAAKGFVRHELVERLHMRRAPEVLFMLDQTEEIEKRINELLHKPESSEKP
jgi:ribosome-binding factor A